MALLHKGHGGLEVLRRVQLKEHGGQAAAGRRGHDEVAELERTTHGHQTKSIYLVPQCSQGTHTKRVTLGQVAQAPRQPTYRTAQLVAAHVVLLPLQRITAQHTQFVQIWSLISPSRKATCLSSFCLWNLSFHTMMIAARATGSKPKKAWTSLSYSWKTVHFDHLYPIPLPPTPQLLFLTEKSV